MKIGLIVNPYAGSGGKIGKKGSDDLYIENPDTKTKLLRFLKEIQDKDIEFYTPKMKMGEYFLNLFPSIKYQVIDVGREKTTREDTILASKILSEITNIIVFAGGDGTARDVSEGLKLSNRKDIPILGIPTGVKMHSGVFAATPEAAGKLIKAFIDGLAKIKTAEILDIDEEKYRKGIYSVKLYDIVYTIDYKNILVESKEEIISNNAELDEIAEYVIENIMNKDNVYYILGPGSTVKKIEEKLGYKPNFLSTDVFLGNKIFLQNANYIDLLQLTGELKLILTPIGRQGFILGRGNQEIGPEVIRKIGKNNIYIVSTKNKLNTIQCLRIDSGDEQIDRALAGIYTIIVGYNEFYAMKTCEYD
ncbi:ATP-NAD kinase [Acidianus sulfidivorans JP7]|uniref:ATP-NAD kinase n=1 Tax=Acidianus sulfidivorans JP7 TaxID=619593 RepID=A0A2U9IP22_9CREN|nr:ATP-NAD kinase family protein [Acidianus sulfidivorans]AWR97780.1 ATP-NAD kinase [Acidianus sulfidivorans JP7]